MFQDLLCSNPYRRTSGIRSLPTFFFLSFSLPFTRDDISNLHSMTLVKDMPYSDLAFDSRVVATTRVVVHNTGWLGPGTSMSDNHWSIYLILANGKDSVRLNMRADYGDPEGTLECSSHSYTCPTSALRFWDYRLRDNVTVGHIYQLLLCYRRHQYRMSGGGSGCRFWMYVWPHHLRVQHPPQGLYCS